MVRFEFPGARHQFGAMCDKTDVLTSANLAHNPFLVFVVKHDVTGGQAADVVEVRRVNTARELVSVYPDATPVLVQWPGQRRSDFFETTVAEVREQLAAHDSAEETRAVLAARDRAVAAGQLDLPDEGERHDAATEALDEHRRAQAAAEAELCGGQLGYGGLTCDKRRGHEGPCFEVPEPDYGAVDTRRAARPRRRP